MSSQREYNIDKLIRDFESDDAVAALLGENDTYGLANFIYFRNPENVNSLISKIFELDVNRRMRVIKGLVSLYPISATILFPIIKSVKSEEIEADLADWFDISETYVMTFNKLITAADRSGDKVEAKYKSALDEKIKTLADLREENKELHNLKIENESKRKEIENLERENKELKTKYSKENIERQIADLKSENDKREFYYLVLKEHSYAYALSFFL